VAGVHIDRYYQNVFASYSPPTPTAAALPENGADLLPGMRGTPSRFFDPAWNRDFIAMLARQALKWLL